MRRRITVVAVVACCAWACSRNGASQKRGNADPEAKPRNNKEAVVATCEKALQQLKSMDLRGWTGLPGACTKADVTAVFAGGDDAGGRFHLGSEFDAATFHMLSFPGHTEPLQMWLVDGDVRLLETEDPKLVGGLDALKADLGEPEATLEFAWDVLTVKGELVWPGKGITVFVNPGNQVVLRVAVYAPTTLDAYKKHLRVDRTTREH